MELKGEDRNYGGNKLFVDLIPSSCWFKNVRSSIDVLDWADLREHIYGRVNHKCECCGRNCLDENVRLDAHERWEYDTKNKKQILKRLIALCCLCHNATHYGLACVKGLDESTKKYLQKVRGDTDDEVEEHISTAFNVWMDRNGIKWELDITLITDNNIKIVKAVDKRESILKSIAEKGFKDEIDYNNRKLKPCSEEEFFWIIEKNESIFNKKTLKNIGKWMMFYDKKNINEKWNLAKKYYKKGLLTGVLSLKVSTAKRSSRAQDKNTRVIIFYCNKSHMGHRILKIGKKLSKKMNYNCKMYYKTDQQTAEGTRSLGVENNFKYSYEPTICLFD